MKRPIFLKPHVGPTIQQPRLLSDIIQIDTAIDNNKQERSEFQQCSTSLNNFEFRPLVKYKKCTVFTLSNPQYMGFYKCIENILLTGNQRKPLG